MKGTLKKYVMIKKILVAAIALPLAGYAQVLKVGTVEKVSVPAETPSVAAFSPNGDFLLLTSPVYDGLVKYDLSTRKGERLTDAPGAGYGVKLSSDGRSVVYRENSYDKNHLRHVSLHSMNLSNGKSKRLLKASRNLQGYSVEGAQASIVNNGKKTIKTLASGVRKTDVPSFSINDRQLMITKDGKTSVFSPNGTDNSYIWPELSPDATKVVYYVAGLGAFVCNVDGTRIIPLGIVRAPKWYDGNTVVGMRDEDDGEKVCASSVVAVTLDGKRQVLTADTVMAMYPQPAQNAGRISFSTPQGGTYIINVSK